MNMKTLIDNIIEKVAEQGWRVDTKRTLYFDESNNIRKGIISLEADNVPDLENKCFVLGGIGVFENIDFDELLKFIGCEQKPSDAKFKFFSRGKSDFLEAIKQERFCRLFQYLFEHGIIIHFSVLHYFHLALTDILDSLIEEHDANEIAASIFYKNLQSDMTEVLYKDYNKLHRLLCEYEFPNISHDKVNKFINDILELYTENLCYFDKQDIGFFTKEMLRQIIKAKKDKNKLCFLDDNVPFVISGKMAFFYLFRMANFVNKKYFDEEPTVISEIKENDTDYENKLNAKFINSKSSREVQVSDAVSGFVARYYGFLCKNSNEEICRFVKSLDISSNAFKTLYFFLKLITVSDKESPIYLQKTLPLFIENRNSLFIELLESSINKDDA